MRYYISNLNRAEIVARRTPPDRVAKALQRIKKVGMCGILPAWWLRAVNFCLSAENALTDTRVFEPLLAELMLHTIPCAASTK